MFVDIFNTDKKYDIIYADPPWSYENKYPHSSALYEYPTLSLDNLKLLPVEKLANDNSVLFLWFTYPLIKEALELIEAWGFKYKTLGFQWIKLSKTGQKLHWGTGYWTRRNSEGCFIATKGGGIRSLNHDVHE
jgi:N6-adenosine-specific RNA methylase IME4